ncbi:MAG TPA: 6-hydroxymethylpterin diphosphokinase MptE-like protein, partial [Vicinamibacterales bacterium]|nr:6-hydroxymethylpterin diphosphokinase MptE-like protein [Vicinamibacterales bacterium]
MTGPGDVEQQLAIIDVSSSSTLFVIGLGRGDALEALDRQGWTGRVVAFEPLPALAASLADGRDWSQWLKSGRLTILPGPAYHGLDRVIPSLDPNRPEPVILIDADVAAAGAGAVKDTLRIAARAWFGARANQEARRQNAGRYLLNTLRNAPAIAAAGDTAVLTGAFTGVPTLIVAAGPSLDRNLPGIVKCRDRVLLIAVDTALRPLLAAGVQPDFVVAVDPSEANASHLVELPPCPETWLVAEGSLDPEGLRHFAGRTFFFRVADHHPWPWLRGLGVDRGRLRAWGSVLTTAFDLALTMECDPIVFAGADLAFTGGRPYARGTTNEEEWRREEAWGQTLEEIWAGRVDAWPKTFETGVDGTRARTAPHLRSFRDWIVAEATRAAGRTIINATRGGILVGEGVQQATLAQTLGPRPPLSASVRESTASLRGRTACAVLPAHPPVTDDVQCEWIAIAGVTPGAIAGALAFRSRAEDLVSASSTTNGRALPAERVSDAETVSADAAYLTDLAQTTAIRLVPLVDPAQDLLGELRRESLSLGSGEALVVSDEAGIGAGRQVRQAVDALLCERPDLWLEYRRFVDHESRLTVIRGDAFLSTPPAAEADAAKWEGAHRPVADSLAPLIVSHLSPASVVDVGCGAGYWLTALAHQGVGEVCGITPRLDGDGVIPDLMRAALDAVPDLGRRFDVCLCLEVAQGLPPAGQDALIASCAHLSDVVVFSSRPPGAVGSSPHDRPLPYWAAAFWRHGYVLDDGLRKLIEHRWSWPRT